MQPLARLVGRLSRGLSPLRRRRVRGWERPRVHTCRIWTERGRSIEEWLESLEGDLRKAGARVVRGGNYDRWDLEVSCGTLGRVRIATAIEEHGGNKQLARFKLSPHCLRWAFPVILTLLALAGTAVWHHAWVPSAILLVLGTGFGWRTAADVGAGMAVASSAIDSVRQRVHGVLCEPDETTGSAGDKRHKLAAQSG
jgi:hypothetical protein